MKLLTLTICLLICYTLPAQFFFAPEFSKDVALYMAKDFVCRDVLKVSDTVVIKFRLNPLSAANSGELTSLVYNTFDKKINGLVLGFFGNYWNEAGVVYKGYRFKNIKGDSAVKLLNYIDWVIENEQVYINQELDVNNVSFKMEDMTFLIFANALPKIRVFWNGFDSEWNIESFKKTKRLLELQLNQ